MSLFRFLSNKANTGSVAGAHSVATSSHGAVESGHGHGHGHGHDSHVAPWEGVNLWRTPYKGDVDTVTHVKRTKGTLDRYVENRVRRIQELQLYTLVRIKIKDVNSYDALSGQDKSITWQQNPSRRRFITLKKQAHL